MNRQHTANQLNEYERGEAEKIARRLFGMWDWQGMLQQVEGPSGLTSYINRSVIRRIAPAGARWLVAERHYNDGISSAYYIKRL